MRSRGGGAADKGGGGGDDKVLGPLFPRLHVNDTSVKGGPRAPPRNKMALYEQFSVPSHRFSSSTPAATAPPHPHPHPSASASAGQIGGSDRPLFPSFCVPSNEPARSSAHINTNSNGRDGGSAATRGHINTNSNGRDGGSAATRGHINTNSNGRDGGSTATRGESGRQSVQLKSRDTYTAGSTAECSSQHRENNIVNNSSGKKLANEDDFMVPSVFCSGLPPHSTQEEVRVQDKSTPFPATSPYKTAPTMSKSFAKFSNTDKRNMQGSNVSDTRSRDSPSIKDKEPTQTTIDLEVEERSSPFQSSKAAKAGDKVSFYRDRFSSLNASDKQLSQSEGHHARRKNDNVIEPQNAPKAGNRPSSTDVECNGASDVLEKSFRETGEKRKRSTRDHEVQKDDSSGSSVESLPGLEISPDDVVGAIGPKHFWKARRAIVNQQRVFAVQVFELHRLIKVQKLIAASPHLLIEGDPCLGNALVASKKKRAEENVDKQLPSAKNKDDPQLALQQAEYSKDNSEGNQPSPSPDDTVVVQHNSQAVTNGAVSSSPSAMPLPSAAPENKQNTWCTPPQNQWLVPVMSPSEGLVYKPYTGPCPPAGSFLAPFYASCAPLSLPSTAGDFMNSPYGIPMPHQPQHMGLGGPPPMPPMYFPPFSMPVMNPVVSASAVEQVSRVAPARPSAQVVEHHWRSSCNMRNEAVSGGIWRFHASRDSELQGSSAASSPFDRQQGEARGPAAAPPVQLSASSARNGQPQPSSGSKENPAARVIRVVPHTARTASESAARIFRSIQMEREQNEP